ncbi:MAG TPA: glycosyltransferase [Methylomirabilota bacterium]|nr:glycosyltransferase [Methylomirabilota bacterium]
MAVVVVNWKGWADTIECLESLLRSNWPSFRVIVCDNGSADRSFEHLQAWAAGLLDVVVAPGNPLRGLLAPPVAKPVAHTSYDRTAAEAGGGPQDRDTRLVFIQTGSNLGFAGGVNVGLRYVLARDEFAYAWVLNNDTVVRPDTLGHLVRRMEERPDAGMCGSTLLSYDPPHLVQALAGARYNKWLGGTWHIGARRPASAAVAEEARVERRLSYIMGASMLVSRRVLEDIGLMSEDYFLFFEEVDWAFRIRGRYALTYAPGSVLYHKGGASTGANMDARKRSLMAERLLIRNRLRITRKFYPFALPTVYLGVLASMLLRLAEREWRKAGTIAAIALGLGRTAPVTPVKPRGGHPTGGALDDRLDGATPDRRRRSAVLNPLVVIPAFNEAASIAAVVRRAAAIGPGLPVLVVDDGSTDGTAAVARTAGARVVRLPFNMGYGVALQTGYKHALREGYDCVVQLDGDGQHEPADVPLLLSVIDREEADVALGSRFINATAYRPSIARRIGMRLFSFLAFALTGMRFSDVTSGFQALSRDVLRFYTTERYPVDYPDADVLIMLKRAGFRVKEVPVRMYPTHRPLSMHSGLRPIYYVFKMLLSIALVPLRRDMSEPKEI